MILTNCSFSILLSHVHIYMCSGDFIEDGEENMQQIIYAYISVSVIMNIYIIYIYFISMYLYITWHSHCIHELMETMIICTSLEPLQFRYVREKVEETSSFPEDVWQLKWWLDGRGTSHSLVAYLVISCQYYSKQPSTNSHAKIPN
jgi:hypothetical protein